MKYLFLKYCAKEQDEEILSKALKNYLISAMIVGFIMVLIITILHIINIPKFGIVDFSLKYAIIGFICGVFLVSVFDIFVNDPYKL